MRFARNRDRNVDEATTAGTAGLTHAPWGASCAYEPCYRFTSDLIRDANRIDRLDAYQKRRMLERAVDTICELRQTIGLPDGPGRDSMLYIHAPALSLEHGWRDNHQIREAFLTAAGMIRDLHIILHSETKIKILSEA